MEHFNKAMNIIVAAFIVFLSLLFVPTICLLFWAFRIDSEERLLYHKAADKCHEQNLAVIYDHTGFPICVSTEILIEQDKY